MVQLVKKKKKICLQCRRSGFDPWVGKIPWRRERLPTAVLCLEKSMDWIVHGVSKSRTQLSDFHSLHFHALQLEKVSECSKKDPEQPKINQ